jgi:hypothetical protein
VKAKRQLLLSGISFESYYYNNSSRLARPKWIAGIPPACSRPLVLPVWTPAIRNANLETGGPCWIAGILPASWSAGLQPGLQPALQ